MEHAQLTPDIIHDLIIDPLPTLDICRNHQLSVDQLHALVTSEQFKRLADQLSDIDHARAPFTRARMLEVLNSIAQLEPQSPTHTETIRKAAAQLLRITEPPRQGSETHTEDDPQPDDHHPDHDKQHKRAPGRNTETQYDPHHQKQQAQNQRDGPTPDNEPLPDDRAPVAPTSSTTTAARPSPNRS